MDNCKRSIVTFFTKDICFELNLCYTIILSIAYSAFEMYLLKHSLVINIEFALIRKLAYEHFLNLYQTVAWHTVMAGIRRSSAIITQATDHW